MLNSIITGSGTYIPKVEVKNKDFIDSHFYNANGEQIDAKSEVIIEKFEEITGIKSRRYLKESQSCSDIASIAAKNAIENAGVDAEEIEYVFKNKKSS